MNTSNIKVGDKVKLISLPLIPSSDKFILHKIYTVSSISGERISVEEIHGFIRKTRYIKVTLPTNYKGKQNEYTCYNPKYNTRGSN